VAGALTIARVETFVVALPLRRPHLWAGLAATSGQGYVVLKLALSDGTVGWGEAQTLANWGGDDGNRYGETPVTTRHVIDDLLLPRLAEVDVRNIEVLHAAMARAVRGYPYAKAAVEVAVLDALGRSLGVPIYQLLGGRCRDRVAIAHSIGLMPIEEAVAEAVQVVEEGVRTLKLKIGIDVERDVALVRAVRQAVGDGPALRVDANQGYRTWAEALTAIRRMSDYDIAYAEQLVDGIDELAEVAMRSPVPVMADESVWTDRDVVRIAAAGAAHYISTYYTKPGGLYKAKRLLTVAGAHRMISDVNGSGEMGIGNAANLQLAAAAPEIVLPGTIPITSTAETQRTKRAGRKYLDDIVVEPFHYADGHLSIPDRPGLGIEVDEAKLQKYRVA
jgi:muconate cycloisomerase